MKTETRNVENFDKIELTDVGTLILTQGEHESLTIEADEELLKELTTEVRHGTLVLGFENDWLNRFGKIAASVLDRSKNKITYYLTVVNLEKISMSGKCDLECESLKADNLKLKVSGKGNLTFTHLDCNALEVSISGRGEFSAAGRADLQKIRISGSGEYEAPELASQSVKINISGHGNATIQVEESLDITISGKGQVNYYGRPSLRQAISGMGKSNRLYSE